MLPSLAQDALRKVLGFCDASAVVNYGAASKAAAATAVDDVVWRAAASRDFYADPPQLATLEEAYPGGNCLFGTAGAPAAPEGPEDADVADAADVRTRCDRVGPCDSWRAAYRRWFSVARRVRYLDQDDGFIHFPYVRRGPEPFDARAWKEICRAWSDIKTMLYQRQSPILATLRPPASVEDLQRVRVRGLRYAYAIHDGQELAYDIASRNDDLEGMIAGRSSAFHGLFGGTTTCSRLLSIADVERIREEELAAFDREHGGLQPWNNGYDDMENARAGIEGGFWFARDQNGEPRYSVDQTSYISKWNGTGHDRYTFHAPQPETVSVFGSDVTLPQAAPEGHNSFAAWFSTYASRLRSGVYGVAPSRIVLLPEADGGADCRLSEAVTNGIRVRASIVYMPHEHYHGLGSYAYAIRIRRVSDDAPERCQLRSHRWTIRSAYSGEISTESGGTLGGGSPILTRDGWLNDPGPSVRDLIHIGRVRTTTWGLGPTSSPGSFRGELEFVPGSLSSPTGPPFQIVLPELVVRRPEFVYC